MSIEDRYRQRQLVSKVLPLVILVLVVSFGVIAAVVGVTGYYIWKSKPVASESDTQLAPDVAVVPKDQVRSEWRIGFIEGTISYVDAGGENPDIGSVVIVVPQFSRLTIDEKVPAERLGPDEQPPDQSLERINAMGGAYARTDATGYFEMQLPRGGRYFMLVISANGPRLNPSDFNKEHYAEMGRYFLQVTELLTDRSYRWISAEMAAEMKLTFVFGEHAPAGGK